jgi:hypothetical protein
MPERGGRGAATAGRGLVTLVIVLSTAGGPPATWGRDGPDAVDNLVSLGVGTTGGTTQPIPDPPPAAPEPSDVLFVTDDAPALDTGCVFRAGGPLTFDIEVTRYAGERAGDGTLRHAADLRRNGLVGATAKLLLAMYDVDLTTTVVPPDAAEINEVRFNGELVGYAAGAGDEWSVVEVEVPIERVRFPALAGAGQRPRGERNQVRIDIDTGNAAQGKQLWCTAVAWGALQVQVMSPILLVHGNNADGDFFERQGFAGVVRGLHLVHAGPRASGVAIDLPTDTIAANGRRLAGLLPAVLDRFGADSAHLVVHSKGGLDTREFLGSYHDPAASGLSFLSVTSLSTPHNGSVGADLLVQRDLAAQHAAKVEFEDLPFLDRLIAERTGIDAGTPNLTTAFTGRFDAANRPRLPPDTIYFSVAADADVDGDGEIKDTAEYQAMLVENQALASLPGPARGFIINRVYQILRRTASVQVGFREQGIGPFRRVVATITLTPSNRPQGNDTLVTIDSGHGIGTIAALISAARRLTLIGGSGRNHANVADAAVARTVIPSMVRVERARGDLR